MRLINHYPDPKDHHFHIAEIEIKNHRFNEIVMLRFVARTEAFDDESKLILARFGLKPRQVMIFLRSNLNQ